MSEPHVVAIALGANIGDRLASLRAARDQLSQYVDIKSSSHIYETAAAYVTDQPSFLNAALLGTTRLEPLPLLWAIKDLERHLGRRPTFRYGPRLIDIDILFYDDIILSLPELTLPHARMAERDFVLGPLSDIAGDWVHPLSRKSVAGMFAELPDPGIIDLGLFS